MSLKYTLLRWALRVLKPAVESGYRLFYKLRLGVMLLERDLARVGGQRSEQETLQHLSSGAAWVEFCERLKGKLSERVQLRATVSPSTSCRHRSTLQVWVSWLPARQMYPTCTSPILTELRDCATCPGL